MNVFNFVYPRPTKVILWKIILVGPFRSFSIELGIILTLRDVIFDRFFLFYFRTIPLVIAALTLNGIGIGGEQVAGIVDALHEAV